MWWANQQLLNTAKQLIASQQYAGKALFVGIANTMESAMDTLRVQADTSGSTKHIRSILALDRLLKANGQTGLRYQGKYYGLDDHSSVPLITEYDALHFIFDSYRLKLTDQDYEEDNTRLADKLTTHFRAATRQLGYQVKPPESLVNELGLIWYPSRSLKKPKVYSNSMWRITQPVSTPMTRMAITLWPKKTPSVPSPIFRKRFR